MGPSNHITYDTINVEREARGLRRFALGEYEHYRGRYARMAAPGTDLRTFLLSIRLTQQAPDYSGGLPVRAQA